MADEEAAPAYQWYPKDYLSSTPVMMMSLAQEGIYRRLLDYQWLNGWIPEEVADLARLCRITAREMERHWPAVAVCFVAREGGPGLVNRRLEREREKQRAYREKMNKAGKAGAAARWGASDRTDGGGESQSDGNAIASPRQCDSIALQSAVCSLQSASAKSEEEEGRSAPQAAAVAAPPRKAPKKRATWTAPDVPIPPELQTPAFLAAWEARLVERGEPGIKGARPSASSLAAQLEKLRKLSALRGLPVSIACVERATEGRHEGVVFPDDFAPQGGRNGNGKAPDLRRTAGNQDTHVPRPNGFRAFPDEKR